MLVTITNDGVKTVISPSGEIDYDTLPDLLAAAQELSKSVTHVTWDLREVLFMDSTGLHLLDDQWSACLETGHTLAVTGLQAQPLYLLRLIQELSPEYRWADFLPACPSAAAA
ncbi:STAS domain-containing protein [Streptomyces sp. NPDC059371]|uniref:STAS domain-containing protein n=1 Tax=Streptomyces sp. NPDC059371 TaxID=3346812 RepID=UPI0036760D2E